MQDATVKVPRWVLQLVRKLQAETSLTDAAITSTFLISNGSFYAEKKAENVTIKLCSLNNVPCTNKTNTTMKMNTGITGVVNGTHLCKLLLYMVLLLVKFCCISMVTQLPRKHNRPVLILVMEGTTESMDVLLNTLLVQHTTCSQVLLAVTHLTRHRHFATCWRLWQHKEGSSDPVYVLLPLHRKCSQFICTLYKQGWSNRQVIQRILKQLFETKLNQK